MFSFSAMLSCAYEARLLLVPATLGYLLLVRAARWRVYTRVHRKYAYLEADPARMTPGEAQDIVHASMVWDLPVVLSNALSFAIVRTYAIPSISRILCGSKELKVGPSVSKRYLDTAIIAATWSMCPISATEPPSEYYAWKTKNEAKQDPDPRAFIAIARMNWLHAHYPISNDDYLYTLSLFILEPVRWARRFGWRPLSPLEVQARHVFYRQIGEFMNIRDIPASLEDLTAWSEAYEEQYMKFAETNNKMAHGMLNELSLMVPSFAHGLFQGLLVCTFDERMRIAMGLPEQPKWMHAFVRFAVAAFQFTQGHLLPPRLRADRVVPLETPTPLANGRPSRMYPEWPVTKPWYVPRPTGFGLLLEKMQLALGLRSAEDVPGPRYGADGYRLEELGPMRWKDAGHEQVMKMAGDMMGCPVRGVWAAER